MATPGRTYCPPLEKTVAEAISVLPDDFAGLFVDVSDANIAQVREQYARMIPRFAGEKVITTDHLINAASGVTVRVHRPAHTEGPVPCLYWMHAGGYIVGRSRDDDALLGRWCEEFGCAAVSVDYRLAPETAYPGPLDDCYQGLCWVFEHAEQLGIDRRRTGLGGRSAGGGLAAALALMARDHGLDDLAFQALIYPMLDDRMETASSGWDTLIWPPSANAYGWRAYRGGASADNAAKSYLAAARVSEVAGLPPTLIVVGGADGFVDESVDYAMRLTRAGVLVDLAVYAGSPHGFDGFATASEPGSRARADIDRWLRERLS